MPNTEALMTTVASQPHIALECRSLSHWFGSKRVLHDIHLTIQRGQFVSLVAPADAANPPCSVRLSAPICPTKASCRSTPRIPPSTLTGPRTRAGSGHCLSALFTFPLSHCPGKCRHRLETGPDHSGGPAFPMGALEEDSQGASGRSCCHARAGQAQGCHAPLPP